MAGIECVLLLTLGLCVGSFVNVLIWRIPRGEEFVRTSSHCVLCGHRLSWRDLIPVVSFLLLRGRCRYCGSRITRRYPAVELLNALLWLWAGLCFRGDIFQTAVFCGLGSLLLALAFIDWEHFIIPNGINLAIALLGLLRLMTDGENRGLYLAGMLGAGGMFWLLHHISGGRGMGMGDVKLAAAAGLLLGWQKMVLAVLIASLSGIGIHSLRMKRGAGSRLAFGPYLALGIWLAALTGERVTAWYLTWLGL